MIAPSRSERMRAGVDLLGQDDRVWRAFQLANRAMLMQRARTVWHEHGKPAGGPDDSVDHRWRPFQLAFILLCLRGVVDDRDAHRETADLLWFPTGGGKTEAYLGLIAFTLFLRRLRDGSSGDGVGVFMRYTLRLLTIQQFERAALLICCCETIRRTSADLGAGPDSDRTLGRPGRDAQHPRRGRQGARPAARQISDVEEGNPVQLHRCPWCGRHSDRCDYWIDDAEQAAPRPVSVPQDRQRDCPFGEGLPVVLVDEDIYARRPIAHHRDVGQVRQRCRGAERPDGIFGTGTTVDLRS